MGGSLTIAPLNLRLAHLPPVDQDQVLGTTVGGFEVDRIGEWITTSIVQLNPQGILTGDGVVGDHEQVPTWP